MHIGIAGAGLLGRLLALEISRKGHRVEVFDGARDPGPRETSGTEGAAWTAAGMLSPVAELDRSNEDVFRLGLRSCALWPGIAQALGMPEVVHFDGSLLVAHRSDAGAAQRLVGLLQTKAGAQHQPQPLSVDALAELEASVHGPALAWLLPCEGYVEVHNTLHALHAQGTRQGVQWHWGRSVHAVEQGALVVDERRTFDHVFDVRGVGARAQLPVRGVRGEIFLLHAPEVSLRRPLRLMHPRHSVYIVPRPDNYFVVGASEIESEDRSSVSLRSTLELLSAAHSAIPALAEARVVHSESNLRPALPDNLPLLQHSGACTRINGLYRHGWLLAPALVEQACQELEL
ncbi:MAG: FAD-dependent oxidoreductase [Burkholderiales bacterium]|nr:FAD-dependent oxidoreductase [Burkholderiales bacterium]